MLSGKFFKHTIPLPAFFAALIAACFSSCIIVKHPQPGKPFVYQANIHVISDLKKEERQGLESGLYDQLHDSLQVRTRDWLFWRTLKSPPAYDSLNAMSSVQFMKGLLRSQGYYRDSIYYATRYTTHDKEPAKTYIDFYVKPGKQVKLDSVSYTLQYAPLQHIADSTLKDALVKRGSSFAIDSISAELDRLTELYRNSGYLRFSRDELVGVWDTLDIALLRPSLDPFEQFEILRKLQERRERPTANLDFRLKSPDSTRFVKYFNGHVTIYPDYNSEYRLDTTRLQARIDTAEGIRIVQYYNKFKAKIFPPNIYLPADSLYQLRRYFRTLNRLNSLNTWRNISIDQVPRPGTDTVDFVILMTPAKKYAFQTNLESSINQSAISGNLFGIGVNVGLQNRNFARVAATTSTNLRYGVELGHGNSGQFIQTQQVSLSYSIIFPRFVPASNLIRKNYRDNFRSLFNFNTAYTERFKLYKLITINGSWGYEFQRRRVLLNIKLPNIEYSRLNAQDSLKNLMLQNPSLRNIFTDGFISSIIASMTLTGGTSNRPNVLRVNVEQSGLATGIIRSSFLDTQLYRFVKADVEFAKLFRFKKTSLALRAFAGIGYEFNSTRNPLKRNNLPFFKQYFSGGPNSMRAWQLRRLGPGSIIKPFDGSQGVPDRYGDIQLEANAEYRFPLGRPFGIKVNGAFFTDIGNIWFLKQAPDRLPEEIFNISRLGKDIAIGAGGGLRFDFNFFVIRFDYSYKVKDPSPSPANLSFQNKWFSYPLFKGSQFQLGINYPFIF